MDQRTFLSTCVSMPVEAGRTHRERAPSRSTNQEGQQTSGSNQWKHRRRNLPVLNSRSKQSVRRLRIPKASVSREMQAMLLQKRRQVRPLPRSEWEFDASGACLLMSPDLLADQELGGCINWLFHPPRGESDIQGWTRQDRNASTWVQRLTTKQ